MKTVEEYLQPAKDCALLPQRAESPEERTMIAGMAETWRLLARHREQQIKGQPTIASMPDRGPGEGFVR